MIRNAIFCITFCLTSLVCAQNRELDSLKSTLSQVADSTKISIYDELTKALAFKIPDSAQFYGFAGLELIKKYSNTEASASILLNLGTSYYAQGNYDEALNYWQQALDVSSTTASKKILPLAMNNVAVIYQNTGRIDKAISYYKQAIDVYRLRKDTTREGRGTFNVGKAYVALGQDSLGLSFINRSIEIYNQLGERAYKNLANAYNEVATVHFYDGSYAQALENYQQSVRYYEAAGDHLGATKPKGNIGNIHLELKAYQKSIETYKEIIEIKEGNKQFTIHFNYHNLGNAYKAIGMSDSAFYFYRKALALRKGANLAGFTSSTLVQMGLLSKQLGLLDSAANFYKQAYDHAKDLDEAEHRVEAICYYGDWLASQTDLDRALPLLVQCYDEASDINHRKLLVNAAGYLHEYYVKKNEFEKAYYFLNTAAQLKDSIFNADIIREIATKEAEFNSEKELLQKQNEIELLSSKEEIANLRITILSIGVVFIVVIAFFVGRTLLVRKERKRREVEAIAQFKEAMAGMIAHDLKTPLSVIMNASGDETNKQMAGQMLRLVNNMLDVHKLESTDVKLNLGEYNISDLVEKAISQVHHLAKEKEVTLIRELAKVVVRVDEELMVRIFVNLLTNAIKYSPLNGQIKIQSQLRGGCLKMSVSDEGKGISMDQVESIFKPFEQVDPKEDGLGSTGLGLTFVKLAIEAHGSCVDIDSDSRGATFSFEINEVLSEDNESITRSTEVDHFSLPDEVRASISKRLDSLRALDIHQIGEIERELSDLKERKDVGDWVEAVLNAAYSGNQKRYDQLVDESQLS